MIEIDLLCTEDGNQTRFLARKHGEEWLFWCQHCARVFVVDHDLAERILRGGSGRHCSLIVASCR